MDGGRILVIVPSRQRPLRLTYMLDEALRLSGGAADFAGCTDDDDDSGYENPGDPRVLWFRGRRRSMCAWTNYVASHPRACRYSALGSFGDDHVPRTRDWDLMMAAGLAAPGTGIVYGDDL